MLGTIGGIYSRFNPRICKRCDVWTTSSNSTKLVSIHASVKDATQHPKELAPWCRSFNPRICKRCDQCMRLCRLTVNSFNPRICKRCDSISCSYRLTDGRFNPRICKRCDHFICQVPDRHIGFNPRICKRCDDVTRWHFGGLTFQSTHL